MTQLLISEVSSTETETSFVATQAILLEIGNALAKQRDRPAAIALLSAIVRSPLL